MPLDSATRLFVTWRTFPEFGMPGNQALGEPQLAFFPAVADLPQAQASLLCDLLQTITRDIVRPHYSGVHRIQSGQFFNQQGYRKNLFGICRAWLGACRNVSNAKMDSPIPPSLGQTLSRHVNKHLLHGKSDKRKE